MDPHGSFNNCNGSLLQHLHQGLYKFYLDLLKEDMKPVYLYVNSLQTIVIAHVIGMNPSRRKVPFLDTGDPVILI